MALALVWSLVPGAKALEVGAKFHRLQIDDGLSQSVVISALQDSRGFMWFGTQDGLNRYDGKRIHVFRNDPDDPSSLINNSIFCLAEDDSGYIWIGTEGDGLCRFDRRTQRFRQYRDLLFTGDATGPLDVYNLCVDRQGRIWLATGAYGLLRFDPRTQAIKTFQHDPADSCSLSDDWVWAVLEDSRGAIWAGTQAGLCRLDPATDQVQRYHHAKNDSCSLSDDTVYSLCEDATGTIWVGTIYGLNRHNPAADDFTRYFADQDDRHSLSGHSIYCLYADRTGRIWVGTGGNGLNVLDPALEKFQRFQHDAFDLHSLSDNEVDCITMDRTGVLWVGTGNGVSRLDTYRKPFAHYRHSPADSSGLSNNFVWSLLEDGEGLLWIATTDGLNRLDPQTGAFTVFRHDPEDSTSLGSNDLTILHEDRQGWLWIGGANGLLSRMDRKTGKFENFQPDPDNPDGLSSDRTYAFYEGESGTLWIATFAGLVGYDPASGSFKRYRLAQEEDGAEEEEPIRTLCGDSAGRLWIGTWGTGIICVNRVNHDLTRYRHDPDDRNSLSNDNVLCFHEDRNGVMWIGTGNGLNRFEPQSGEFKRVIDKDGLPNNTIYGILEDDVGRLWISTNNGLCRFDPANWIFDNYDASDGLQGNEFNMGAFTRGASGRMYVGGINGFNIFYPDSIRNNLLVPKVVITDFELFNRPVPIGEISGGRTILDRDIAETEALTLSYQDYVVSFGFSAIHYASPERNQYAYLLEGFDSDWNYIGNRGRATYTNLPPGNYVFRVKAANCDGIWNEKGAALAITVTPPYWKTAWFLALVLLMGSSAVWGAHHYRTRLLRIRAQSLRRRVDERTAELRSANQNLKEEIAVRRRVETALRAAKEEAVAATRAKSEFLANMSHEIRTPMNGVIGMTALLRESELNPQQREYCEIVQASARTLLALINDILDFSKIEAGKLDLETIDFDLWEVVEDVSDMLALSAADKGLQFTSWVSHEVPTDLRGDPARLRQVLMNLANNAVKFTNRGQVEVRVTLEAQSENTVTLRLEVRDTGMGIPADSLDRLFESFSQVDASMTRKHGGTGLGLAIARQLCELMGGTMGVRSALEEGTTFWFTAEFPRVQAGPCAFSHKLALARQSGSWLRTPARVSGASCASTCSTRGSCSRWPPAVRRPSTCCERPPLPGVPSTPPSLVPCRRHSIPLRWAK